MLENVRRFRQKLREGRFCLGPGISFADPAVTEALAPTFDFVWIDLEHTTLGGADLVGHLIAARVGGAASLVRVPTSDTGWIKRVLDTGAEGVIVPQIRSADEARQVVADCRYAPAGRRGFGPRRPSNYGRHGGVDYLREANDSVFVAVQIENAEALAELDAIVAIEGLDSIIIGPNDLAAALGHPGDIDHAEVRQAIETIIARGRDAGRWIGIGVAGTADHAVRAAEMGVHWAQCGADFTYMVDSADRLADEVRARLG